MIAVTGLTKRYGDFVALRGLDFAIARGEVVGFLGPNGAGKSTTMKILTGCMPATSGRVCIDGLDVADDSLAVRARIGYLPENTPLHTDMLVTDYLRHVGAIRGVPRRQLDARVAEVAAMCGLSDRRGQPIGTLSKGYRQRVGLAQALIHDPDVLVLDEPTSGLDPNQIVEIRNLIRALGRERTILLSTHNLPEVNATCSRVIIIHRGQLVADGTPEHLEAHAATTQRLRLVLSAEGRTPEAVQQALQRIDGVSSVRAVDTHDGTLAWELEGPPERDLRAALFASAVSEGWVVLELWRDRLDLEGLFQRLTQEV